MTLNYTSIKLSSASFFSIGFRQLDWASSYCFDTIAFPFEISDDELFVLMAVRRMMAASGSDRLFGYIKSFSSTSKSAVKIFADKIMITNCADNKQSAHCGDQLIQRIRLDSVIHGQTLKLPTVEN